MLVWMCDILVMFVRGSFEALVSWPSLARAWAVLIINPFFTPSPNELRRYTHSLHHHEDRNTNVWRRQRWHECRRACCCESWHYQVSPLHFVSRQNTPSKGFAEAVKCGLSGKDTKASF